MCSGVGHKKLTPALSMWELFIPPAMAAKPSALSHVDAGESPSGPATKNPSLLGESGFQLWIEFQKSRNKAVSKDTWSLFIDFVRTIDSEFKEYDESGELGPFLCTADISRVAVDHRRVCRVRARAPLAPSHLGIGTSRPHPPRLARDQNSHALYTL